MMLIDLAFKEFLYHTNMSYIVIIEIHSVKKGYLVGEYENEQDAKMSLKNFEEFLTLELVIDLLKLLENYTSYSIIGEDYFAGDTENYMDRYSTSGGQLTLQIIRCKSQFDFEQFVKERNGSLRFF